MRLAFAALIVIYPAFSAAESLEEMRARGMQCVEPVEVIRKQHMELLLHQRDLTMRQGIRTEQHSLNQCVECHVQRNNEDEFIPVNAPEQFCAGCHAFASVSIDCFECHATTPDLPLSANVLMWQSLAHSLAQELAHPSNRQQQDPEVQ